jgi:general secretion pathway protein H
MAKAALWTGTGTHTDSALKPMKQHPAIAQNADPIQPKNIRRSGFTLIEIAIVMAIIGMIMLLVIPKLPSSDQENLKISARTLASTLRYLQERAATSRTGYYITLTPGTESVKISELGADGSAKEPLDPLLQKSPMKDGILVADVRIPRLGKIIDGELRIDVGVAGVRDFVTIHLRTADAKFWTVMAFPSGGKVKAYPGYLEDPP